MAMPNILDQHELMTRVLCHAGGRQIEEMMPREYQGKKADIAFPSDAVVVEVKTIATDRASDPRTADALGLMFSRNASRGAPIVFGEVSVRLHDLPRQIAERAMRVVGKRVQREAAEANRQIKASKAALGLDAAYGLLVFVTPPYRLDRHSIVWLFGDAIRGGTCRSINGIMVVETPLSAPAGTSQVGNSFLSFHSRDERELPLAVRERIGRAWGEVTGQAMQRAREEDFAHFGATA